MMVELAQFARKWRRRAFCAALTLMPAILLPDALQNARANGDTRSLNMFHNHTGERINITYKRDGRYDRDALEKLNWFLRDWRKNKSIEMDPQLLDLVWEVYRDLGATSAIHIICGYRDEVTNEMLRGRSIVSGVAQHSQHTQGRAMDISIPGVPTQRLREMGFLKQRGGVGYYARSGFVHLDVANVRAWPRMTTQQLARLFPEGETLHLPSDGPPLAGYQTALARFGRNGKLDGAILASRSGANKRDDNYVVAALTPRGVMRNPSQPPAPVVAVAAPEPAPLAERLNPVLAGLPEKDASRLEPAAVTVAAVSMSSGNDAPQPLARPSGLVSMEEAQTVAALGNQIGQPLNLMPQTLAMAAKPRSKAVTLTAPRYGIAQASLLPGSVSTAPQTLTAPKFRLVSQLLAAPLAAPQGFALKGTMKQAAAPVLKRTAQL